MSRVQETALYAPVKAHLEAAGYEVKAEVATADVVGLREDDLLLVELKTGFSLQLLHQAVMRQALSDLVYVAVPRWKGRAGWRAFKANVDLCKRLGLGVLSVRLEDGFVQIHADPGPFKPRQSAPRRARLLSEFARREGDPNVGGSRGRIVTAYRQDAARVVAHLVAQGPSRGAEVARATGVATATRIMAANYFGWFERVERGIYGLTPEGLAYSEHFGQNFATEPGNQRESDE